MHNNQTNQQIKQEEIRTLISLSQNGCERSKETLVQDNMNLVRSLVKRFRRHPDYEDLMQVGCIGLVKSIDKFDLNMNVYFSTYAVPVILGEVKKYLRDNKSVKVSRQIQENLYKIKKFLEEYQKESMNEARVSDIVKGTGLDEEDVILALGSEKEVISLDKPFGEEGEKAVTLLDSIQDEFDYYGDTVEKQWIEYSMKRLNKQERNIIISRYMHERTQSELAKELGISQAHVSRIEKKALQKIKEIV